MNPLLQSIIDRFITT